MTRIFYSLLLLLCASPAFASDLLWVWTMNQGLRNQQHGVYNHFQAGDSTAVLQMVIEPRRGDAGRSMRIRYQRGPQGYCGAWLHLFDQDLPPEERTFLELSDHPFLSFWVRGETGGEDFTVQMADRFWHAKDDSSPAGLASKYLGHPLTTTWEEVVVPLSDFRLKDTLGAGVTLNFNQVGEGVVYIDDITFKQRADTPVPLSQPQAKDEALDREFAKAMWVWHTQPLLFEEVAREELFTFCREHGINEIFLQIINTFENEGSPDVRCIILHPDETRALLKAAHEQGIKVHALDGHPTFALEPQHAKVLSQVDAVIAFNQASNKEERFYGIHHDNEPYLLPSFESPNQESILLQYLAVNQLAMEHIRDANSELVYGVDIPFWYDERKGGDGLNCEVTFKGVRQNAARHLIGIIDNVGIMDYRNFAGGADGMIAHGESEVLAGTEMGKRIYLGAETFRDEPTPVYFTFAIPNERWSAFVSNAPEVAQQSTMDGFKMVRLGSATHQHIGLTRPASADPIKFTTALHRLGQVGLTHNAVMGAGSLVSEAAQGAIAKDGMFTGYEPFTSNESNPPIEGFISHVQMLEKVTFAGKTKAYLEEVLDEVNRHFANQPGYAGTAIHYYKTYKALP